LQHLAWPETHHRCDLTNYAHHNDMVSVHIITQQAGHNRPNSKRTTHACEPEPRQVLLISHFEEPWPEHGVHVILKSHSCNLQAKQDNYFGIS
jgi:hypothetical protein